MPLMTPAQARAELGISDTQLRDLTDDGEIPFINVGRGSKRATRRYDPSDIEAFKAARRRVECRSISDPVPAPTPTISSSGAVDLAEIRARRKSEKLKSTKSKFAGRSVPA